MAYDYDAAGQDLMLPELGSLRRDFPRYSISLSYTTDVAYRFVAVRKAPGPGPHTLVTRDPEELRAELADAGPEPGPVVP